MKKLFALVAIATLTLSANAQYTPEKGDVSIEMGFNPFSNNFQTFRIEDFKLRFFLNEKNALRLKVGFNMSSDSREDTGYYEPETTTTYPNTSNNPSFVTEQNTKNGLTTTETSNWKFNILFGYEHHYDLSSKLKAYIGAELGYEGTGGSEKIDKTWSGKRITKDNQSFYDYNDYKTYENTKTTTTTVEGSSSTENLNTSGYDALVINAFTGIDFYVYKGLYIGAELGLSFNNRSYNIKESTYSENETTISRIENSNYRKYSENSNITTVKTKNIEKDGSYTNVTTTSGSQAVTTTTTEKGHGDLYNDKAVEKKSKQSENNFKLYVQPALRIGWVF